jgi:hypothetical protein
MAFSLYRRPALERRDVMWFSSWMPKRQQSQCITPRRAKKPPLQRRTFRPLLEELEDRTVPSTLTVTSTADSGPGSLRAEIAAANSGDTINFAPNLSGKTITLTSGQLVVNKSLDIEGLGANRLTVSGNNASRVFDISNNATVTIAGLTIANGSAMSTTDPSQQGGGGVLNEPGATVYITNDVFRNNRALVASGALENVGGPGGPATAIISGTTFISNQAIGSVNGTTNPFLVFDGFGPGGGTAEGGAIDDDGILTLTNSTFTNNQAIGVPGSDGINASAHGGALAVDGTATISGTTFTGNQALGATVPSGFASAQGLGGAVVVFTTATISDSTFAGNEAVGGSGGTTSANNPAFVGAGGGVLVIGGATLSVSDSTFVGNEAIGGAGGTGGGGGVAFGGGLDAHAGTTLTLSDSSFLNNSAIGGAGGSGAAGGAGVGGGLSVDVFSTATITNIAVISNRAIGGVGGAGANGGNGWGGGIDVGGGTIYDGPDGSSVTLSDSLIAANLALGGTGGQGCNGGNGYGGGVIVGSSEGGITPSLTISDSLIVGNRAIGGEEGAGGADGQGIGGGIYNLGTLDLISSLVTGNHASTSNDNIYP